MLNKRLFVTFLLLLIFGCGYFIQAQSKNFVQKLEWFEDDNAYEYKVEVQNIETGKTQVYKTEETFIEFSINPGDYRYRVTALDFLGKESSVSEWRKFTIQKAKTPKVEELPQNVVVSPKRKNQFDIPIDVTSITEETEVVLINDKTNKEIKGSLEIIKEGGEAVASNAHFPEVEEGEWKMKITNPSGLYTETEVIDVTKTDEKAIEIKKENPEEKRLSEALIAAMLEKERKEAEEAEKQRLKEEAKIQAEEEAARLAEEKRLAKEAEAAKKLEDKQLAEEEKLRLAEEKRLAKEEAERLAAEEKQLAEEEKLRLAEEKRLAKEAEAAKKLEEKQLAEEEKLRLAEEKRLAKEEAERLALEEKQRIALEKQQAKEEEDRILAELMEKKLKAKEEEDRRNAEELAEKRRLAEEKRAREQAEREAEEARKAEERRLEEEAKEAARLAEEERKADEMAKRDADRKAQQEQKAKEQAEKEEEAARLAEEKAREAEEKALAAQERREERAKRPKLDLVFSLGGGGLYNAYDGQFYSYNEPFVIPKINLAVMPVVKADIDYLPVKLNGWKFGLNLDGTASYLLKEQDYIKYTLPYGMFNLNIKVQRQLVKEKLYAAVKAGGGVSVFNVNINYAEGDKTQTAKDYYGYLCAQGGASIMWLPVRSFVVETGVDFTHIFIKNMPTGNIMVYMNFGLRL